MISSSTAGIAIAVARGALKFGQRLDALLAEKKAVQAEMPLLMPDIYNGPPAIVMARELKQHLAATDHDDPLDPLGADRDELQQVLSEGTDDAASEKLIRDSYAVVYPERLAAKPLSPDAEFVAGLRRMLPGFDLTDRDALVAAFQITAGKDGRGLGYGARTGLLVADVVAEFGAQNAALFVRDAGMRSMVESVLLRFAEPQLEKFTEWSPLLRHALSVTLNGLLDSHTALAGDSQWLTIVLDVLVEARKDPKGGDEFLMGLFQGRGYQLLLGKGLARAAEVLAEDEASVFRDLAAGVLKAAAPLVAGSATFQAFFADHWGDLLRAGLQGLERHGPRLFADQPELLRNVLVSMVRELGEIAPADLLSNESVFRIADAAIAAVAANPGLLTKKVEGKPWLRAFLESFVTTVQRDGIRLAFSREGLDDIITDAAAVFAEHPELITDAANAGLVRTVVGGILRSVSRLSSLDARKIATAAASGALRGLADHPGLLGSNYPTLIVNFCKRLAELVDERTITGLDATALADGVVEVVLLNPDLFDEATSNLAIAALNAVVRVAGDSDVKLLAGVTLVQTVREVLGAVAQTGKDQLGSETLAKAVTRLAEVVDVALTGVAEQLGRRVDMSGVPVVIGSLVAAWGRGELPDPESPEFQELLVRLAMAASGR